MSFLSAQAFSRHVSEHPELHNRIARCTDNGGIDPLALAELARSQGFDVSPADAVAVLSIACGALSGLERALVSGGTGRGGLASEPG